MKAKCPFFKTECIGPNCLAYTNKDKEEYKMINEHGEWANVKYHNLPYCDALNTYLPKSKMEL